MTPYDGGMSPSPLHLFHRNFDAEHNADQKHWETVLSLHPDYINLRRTRMFVNIQHNTIHDPPFCEALHTQHPANQYIIMSIILHAHTSHQSVIYVCMCVCMCVCVN